MNNVLIKDMNNIFYSYIKSKILYIQYDHNLNTYFLFIKYNYLFEISSILYSKKCFYFDCLSCLSCVDFGLKKNKIELVYHMISIPYNYRLTVKILLDRVFTIKIDSVSSIWKTAEWYEREIFDLFGIYFNNNCNMKRILLPDDWYGHPLLKDYKPDKYYHGILI
ncbi:MAG: NADH-quinone oxidoreductase subunit C [Bacteroides sp.]|nr:MAG: NADH-quinone oxidoreductase subunit C [Bacteroides sp.]